MAASARSAFRRQVAQEFIGGETLHGLSKRHDVDPYLGQRKYEAGALDDDVEAANLLRRSMKPRSPRSSEIEFDLSAASTRPR